MGNQKIFRAKEDFFPLYRNGDEFVIVERTNDERLLPIGAKRLRGGEVYYFEEGDLEEVRENESRRR